MRVGLNVRYLKDLADAIGADEIVLEIGKAGRSNPGDGQLRKAIPHLG